MYLPHHRSSLLAVSSIDRAWTQTHKQGFSVQRVKRLAAQQQSPTYLNTFIYSDVFLLCFVMQCSISVWTTSLYIDLAKHYDHCNFYFSDLRDIHFCWIWPLSSLSTVPFFLCTNYSRLGTLYKTCSFDHLTCWATTILPKHILTLTHTFHCHQILKSLHLVLSILIFPASKQINMDMLTFHSKANIPSADASIKSSLLLVGQWS